MPELSSTGLVAAIDLGSNSFRLEICQAGEGQLQRVEYLKDTVRLGAGLDDMRQLDDAAMSRGWTSVARFAERVRDLEPRAVRAVATATLREALNREAFLSRAQSLLGLPIDVISGHEEARLIWLAIMKSGDRAGRIQREMQSEWYAMAKRHLADRT